MQQETVMSKLTFKTLKQARVAEKKASELENVACEVADNFASLYLPSVAKLKQAGLSNKEVEILKTAIKIGKKCCRLEKHFARKRDDIYAEVDRLR